MPSGATSLQLHAKYAPVNRGSIRYGASRSHGHHTSPKTWSQETGIDLDRLIHDEREYITRMRRRTRRDIDVKPRIQRVYETTVALQMEGVTPSSHKVASRLNIPPEHRDGRRAQARRHGIARQRADPTRRLPRHRQNTRLE